jgi:hypothetical protein
VTAVDTVTVTPLQLADIYDAEADDIQAHCADHSPKDSTGGVWLDCHCAVAHHLRRKATVARQGVLETVA